MLGTRAYQTDWIADDCILKKGFRYNNLLAAGSVHYSQIIITKSLSIKNDRLEYMVDLIFYPSPWPEQADCSVIGQFFLDSQIKTHSWVTLLFSNKDGSAIFSSASIKDVRTFLLCMAECTTLNLVISYNSENSINMPILNDKQFFRIAETFF